MFVAKDILHHKGNEIFFVTPDTSLLDSLKLMAEKHIGAVLVMENEQPVGIFSERDLAREVLNHEQCSLEMPVKKFMSTPVIMVEPLSSIDFCMSLMTNKRIRHLPVMDKDKGRILGVISIGDLVKAVISSHLRTIDALESYIAGVDYGR